MNPFLNKWDFRFLRVAHEVGSWSKDPGTKVGCVLVLDKRILSVGYNGFPSSLSDSFDLYSDRDYKLAVTVHAETNAILNAAKSGAKTESSTAYVTFPPCSQCAAALIQAGVRTVVCPDPANAPDRWKTSFKLGSDMLFESGVTLFYYSQDDLKCQTETAPSVERIGSKTNCSGEPENAEETRISTLSCADNYLPKRLRDA